MGNFELSPVTNNTEDGNEAITHIDDISPEGLQQKVEELKGSLEGVQNQDELDEVLKSISAEFEKTMAIEETNIDRSLTSPLLKTAMELNQLRQKALQCIYEGKFDDKA